MRVAALFVQRGGCYWNLDGVDAWDEQRDARLYDGPHPVVAHPPCQRWGKMWFGQPLAVKRTGVRKIRGDDGGCFEHSLYCVRKYGGLIEGLARAYYERRSGLMEHHCDQCGKTPRHCHCRPTPPPPSEPLVERVAETDRVLPEAPHWNGHGKYGPALCMDECTLHIMSRGFGVKDGDGYLTHDPSKCDWERDDEGGEYVVVPLSNSDLLFLRDQLNVLFPFAALPAPADDVVSIPRQLYAFLMGEGALDGVWFGDDPLPGVKNGAFWWRSALRRAALAKVRP